MTSVAGLVPGAPRAPSNPIAWIFSAAGGPMRNLLARSPSSRITERAATKLDCGALLRSEGNGALPGKRRRGAGRLSIIRAGQGDALPAGRATGPLRDPLREANDNDLTTELAPKRSEDHFCGSGPRRPSTQTRYHSVMISPNGPSAVRRDQADGRSRSDQRGWPGEPSAGDGEPLRNRSRRLPSSGSCRPAIRIGGFHS